MKTWTCLLLLSLAANVYLASRALGSRNEATPAGASVALKSSPAHGAGTAATPGSGRQTIQLGATALASLLAGDLKNMVAGLQAAGFTPEVIRAIVKFRISQQFEGRIKTLVAGDTPFWLSPYALSKSEYGSEVAKLEKEMSAMVTDLLGSDYATPAEEMAARKEFDYLPPEKQAAAMKLVLDFNRRLNEASLAGQSVIPLGFERREALAKLLNPEEYEQYNLRMASTGTGMRSQLRSFEPTEDEFLALFRLRRPLDEKYGGTSPPERTQEMLALQGPIAAALGPDRYADYQLKTTPQYVAIDGLTKRLGLPASALADTLSLQTEIQKRAASVNSDPSLPIQQRQQAITELTAEAENRLSGVLGPIGTAAYKQNGGLTVFMGLRVAPLAPNP